MAVSDKKTKRQRSPRYFCILAALASFIFGGLVKGGQRQFLDTRLPIGLTNQTPSGRLDPASRINLALTLPLQNQSGLTNLLREIYRSGSPSFRHYLAADEFARQFGPSEKDYQAVLNFAAAHGLKVTATHRNRTIVDVTGTVAEVESALHVHMRTYRHPTENRAFYAPDAVPSVDLDTPLLGISGLNNYTLPRPNIRPASGFAQPLSGSGSGGSFFGPDFRAAYAPGVALNGNGQAVGLFELDGYYTSDITNYEGMAGWTNVPLQNILIDGFSGTPSGGAITLEVSLDIEMAIAMAPGLSNVLVYEGNLNVPTFGNDVLNRMATDNAARQLSSSYNFDTDAATDQIFQQFAAQGQSFFQSSGDSDAYSGPVTDPSDDPNITVVGGTFLNTSGPAGSWVTETTWNEAGLNEGTGGGISQVFPIPYWQIGLNLGGNQGSSTMRNLPDVACVAENILVIGNGSSSVHGGTSFSAPLWAGFMALVNQQAALNNQPAVGFANPILYAIGRSTNYNSCFHDITSGNNTNSSSPLKFFAVPGYDLCTGWGTPAGSNLIAALLAPADALSIQPSAGCTFTGPVGGPFFPAGQNLSLTNAGNVPLAWALGSLPAWLAASATNGILAPGAGLVFSLSLNAAATNLPMNDYTAEIYFTNLIDNVAQSFPVALEAGNGGFELGSFSEWTFSGDSNYNVPVNRDENNYSGVSDPLPGVGYAQFVHSGSWGAFLGQSGSLASLSQTVPTVPSQYYLLSGWLSSFAYNGSTRPNEFRVKWNGRVISDLVNMPAFGWTNLQFIVQATTHASALEFDARDDPGALALDDVSMQLAPAPVFQSVTLNGTNLNLSWNTLAGLIYQLQYSTNLDAPNWANLGAPLIASNNFVIVSNVNQFGPRTFYRFTVTP